MFTYIATAVWQNGITRAKTDGFADPDFSDIREMMIEAYSHLHNDALTAGSQLVSFTFTFVHQ